MFIDRLRDAAGSRHMLGWGVFVPFAGLLEVATGTEVLTCSVGWLWWVSRCWLGEFWTPEGRGIVELLDGSGVALEEPLQVCCALCREELRFEGARFGI